MPGYSAGIPIHKAIIVRHTPRDFSRAIGGRNTGAIPISQASVSHGLDYIGREGEYSERSDIDRQATDHDAVLLDDRLDYIGREGIYAFRGAERQVDATYWDQHGPRDRSSVEADMRQAGGAYVDSIVTVGREYMAQLGLETKEDMQRLIRATWSRNVERWGAIRNPEDIRWVACYHTDADRSVHAHIFTWSARGEIHPGYTVSREGTRAGKEEIYRVGYARIRESRDIRRNFIRDLARFETLRQLGRSVPDEDARRLKATAARNGLPYRLSGSSELSNEAKRQARALAERLERSLEGGRGRLARNWEANAIARDLIRLLEQESPSFSALSAEHRACAELLADLKGYGGSGFAQERRAIVRGEREDLLNRVSSRLVRDFVPRTHDRNRAMHGRTPMPGKRRSDDVLMRRARRPLIANRGRPSRDLVSRAYGLSLKQVRAMERDVKEMRRQIGRTPSNGPCKVPARAADAALDYAERAASGSCIERHMERAALDMARRSSIPAETAHARVHDAFVRTMADATLRRIQDERPQERHLEPMDLRGCMLELTSVLEGAARSLAYSAVRGGMRGERDRTLDRERTDRELAI